MNDSKLNFRLLNLASRFYREAEAPEEEDMESLFVALISHDESALKCLLAAYNIKE